MVSPLPAEAYPARLLMVLIGIVVLGFGISLAVIANVVMNSGEAFVKAAADSLGKNFGDVKAAFDVFCVALALVLSLLFFRGVVGTREGTVLSALLTGLVVKFFTKRLHGPVTGLLTGTKS